MAELYGRPVAQFFSEQKPEAEDILVALFRLDPLLARSERLRKEVEHAVGIYQEGVSLEQLLGMPPRSGPPAYAVPVPRNAISAILQGNAEISRGRLLEIAEKLRTDGQELVQYAKAAKGD